MIALMPKRLNRAEQERYAAEYADLPAKLVTRLLNRQPWLRNPALDPEEVANRALWESLRSYDGTVPFRFHAGIVIRRRVATECARRLAVQPPIEAGATADRAEGFNQRVLTAIGMMCPRYQRAAKIYLGLEHTPAGGPSRRLAQETERALIVLRDLLGGVP